MTGIKEVIYTDITADGIIDTAMYFDGARTQYIVMARSPDQTNNNKTVVEAYKRERGQPFPTTPFWTKTPDHKLDHINCIDDGTDLVIWSDTHLTTLGVGDYVEQWVLPGILIPKGAPAPAPVEQPACVPPLNLPNFHPNNNFTRGQACKMIAIAADLPLPTDGRQSFEDVPPDSTFYPYIEAVHEKGAIGGYPCKAVTP